MTDRTDPLLRFIARLQRLEALPRTGWLAGGVVRPESVAAHVHEVALIALWIADTIEEPVDAERVLRIALLHDVSESVTTDIPRPVKELFGRKAFADAEARAADLVLEDAPALWRDCVADYEQGTSLEARIVKAADRIQMLARALAYEASGNGDVRRFWATDHSDQGIDHVRAILDRLVDLHEGDGWFPADFD